MVTTGGVIVGNKPFHGKGHQRPGGERSQFSDRFLTRNRPVVGVKSSFMFPGARARELSVLAQGENMRNLLSIITLALPCALTAAGAPCSEPLPEQAAIGRKGVKLSSDGLRVILPASYAKIDQALSASLDFEIKNLPLNELLVKLANRHKIPIWMDQPSLDLAGISSSTPYTLGVANVRVRDALRLLLEPMELTYTYSNEVLRVCPRQDALREEYSLVYAFPTTYEREDVASLMAEISANDASNEKKKPIVKILRIAETNGREFHLFVEADVFTHQRIRRALALLQTGASATKTHR